MKLPTPTSWPRLSLALVSLVWGSAWIANAVIAEELDALRAEALGLAIACLFLGILGLLQHWRRLHAMRPLSGARRALRRSITLHTRYQKSAPAHPSPVEALPPSGLQRKLQARICATLGCTMLGLPSLLLFWASQHGSGAWAPLIYAALPLGLGVASGKLQAAAVVAVGAMLTLLNGSFPISGDKLLWVLPIAAAVALQGWSLGYAGENREAAGSIFGLFLQLLTATGMLLIAAFLFASHGSNHLRQRQTMLAAVCIGALVYAAGYAMYYRLLQVYQPAQLATSQWLQTLVAVAESAWLLRRMPGPMMLASATLLLFCAWLILQPEPSSPLSLNRS